MVAGGWRGRHRPGQTVASFLPLTCFGARGRRSVRLAVSADLRLHGLPPARCRRMGEPGTRAERTCATLRCPRGLQWRSTPRVDHVQSHRCERRRVTCCNRHVLRGCGCSEVSICVAEGQRGVSGVRRKRCKCVRSVQIERQQAPLEQRQHLAFQPRMQCGPLAALGQVACTLEKCKHSGSVNLPGIDAAIPARAGKGNPGPPSPTTHRYGPGPRHTGSPWR
ncbi:hypothetical protein XCR_4518 [Xanthomonas campestris pv. raphani 756C]|nr:hypothetical protein XCR_4518 [Xanthomonas campestris pv. raphani 756C]